MFGFYSFLGWLWGFQHLGVWTLKTVFWMLFLCSSFKFWCGCPRFFLLNFLLAENSWSVLTECDFVLWCLQSVGSMDLYQLGLTFEVGVWSVKKKKKNSNLIRRYWILLISSNWLSYFCSSDFIFLWILVCYCPSNASVSVWGVGLCFAFLLVNAGIWILLDGACTIFVFMLLNYQSIQALQWYTFYVCSSVVFFFFSFLFFSFLFFLGFLIHFCFQLTEIGVCSVGNNRLCLSLFFTF